MDSKRYNGDRAVILDFLPARFDTLLDIGCAAGEFGSAVRKASRAQVWGVEPMHDAARQAETRLDNVINDFFRAEAPIPEGYFDVVTFNDSLEHFPEPMTPLRLARQKLKANGTLVCCVPNVRYVENVKNLLFAKDWQYTERGILDDTHLRFFTKKSLERTIRDAGFSIQRIEGINPYWDSGRKTKALLPLLGRWAEDMKYFQFVVVAQPVAA